MDHSPVFFSIHMIVVLLVCLLTSNALSSRQERSVLYSRMVITGFCLSSLLSYNNLQTESLSKGIGIYGGLFNVTTFTQGFNLFILIVSGIILLLTAFYPRKALVQEYSSPVHLLFSQWSYNKTIISNKTGEQFRIIEYALVIVFVLCGSLFLMSTGDLISIFLSIELQSYGLYILCTLYRDSESSTASGLTYFLLGGLSSCFILFGSALLYANSGTTNLDNIYVITSISEIPGYLENLPTQDFMGSLYSSQPYYFHLALIIMAVGFLFKISAAPFHFWSPSVYDGIPTIVTTFVAIVAKISLFAFFLELVYYTEYSFFQFSWKTIFLFSSLFSLIIGSLLGLTQFRIKRLFAYSTISHVGFILLALSINSAESLQAYIFYILQYTLSNLNAFVLLVTIGFTFYLYVYNNEQESQKGLSGIYRGDKENSENALAKERNHSPLQLISQIKGYFSLNSFIAVSLGITLFSFVGIPPLVGFFAKQMVLSAALDEGYIFMSFVAILTSVIGAGYYLNLIKQIFFFKHDYQINPALLQKSSYIKLTGYLSSYSKNQEEKRKITFTPENITLSGSLSSIISINTLLLTLFIFMPTEWFNIVSILSLSLYSI